MNIHVTCRHMDMTDSLRNHAIAAVEESFQEFPRITDVHVILDVQKKIHHVAEVDVRAAGHIHIEADHETDDMYASIDGAVEKAHRQLRKKRDIAQGHKHASLGEIEAQTAG